MNRSAKRDSIDTHQLSSAILDNMVTSTLMLDEQLYVRYANPSAEQLFSQSARRIVDHPLSQLIQHASLDLAL
ncbi:PAS domain-containing protein, partial [Vibrio cyclitrophicus]